MILTAPGIINKSIFEIKRPTDIEEEDPGEIDYDDLNAPLRRGR